MKRFKYITMGTAAALAFAIPVAQADQAHFTSHHLVDEKPYEAYAEKLPAENKLELREYLNYEQREPCQFYQPIPEGFVKQGCDIVKQSKVREKAEPIQYKKVLADYDIHFAFDSYAIDTNAELTLNRIAKEINHHKPKEVTVEGHTDTAGPSDYNIGLSQNRASAVSKALTERGVTNRIIDQDAYGETRPAVDTADGVALRANRRVVVEFLK